MDKAYEKYLVKKNHSLPYYAKKYDIDLTPNNISLTRKEMMEQIHKYEMKNMIDLINKGNDVKTKEIGYFIQS
jgi:hypothetical protein